MRGGQPALDLSPVRAELERQRLVDLCVRPSELTMPERGVLAVRGEPYRIAGTELGRLARLARGRLWRAEESDDLVLRTWGDLVVGVVSAAYVPVDHLDLVDALEQGLGRGPFVLQAWEGTWHRLRLVLIDPARRAEARVGDVSHGGLEITNSETGFGALRVAGFLYRLVCKNGAVFSFPFERAKELHRRERREELVARFREMVTRAGDHLQARLGALRQMAELRATPALRRRLRARLSATLTPGSIDALFATLPRRATAYDLYNAVTFRAQRRTFLCRRELEEVGGELVEELLAG